MYKELLTLAIFTTLPINANYVNLISSDNVAYPILLQTAALGEDLCTLILLKEEERRRGTFPKDQPIDFNIENIPSNALGFVARTVTKLFERYERYSVFKGQQLIDEVMRQQYREGLCEALASLIHGKIRRGTLPARCLRVLEIAGTTLQVPELLIIAASVNQQLHGTVVPPSPPARKKNPGA